jgi:hypothetical protein
MAKSSESSLDRIDIELVGIGESLRNSRLEVPPYQRDYAWEKKQVEELLADLNEAISEDESEYFLGSIVVSNGHGKTYQVTDGQQRLATVSILLACIRNYFLETGDNDQAADLENDFLYSRDRRTRDTIPHLKLNVHDDTFFRTAVLERPKTEKNLPKVAFRSNERLLDALRIVTEYLANLVKVNINNPEKVLLDWVEFVQYHAKIIWVVVPDDSNAFTIFETLNDRGLDLAISDLLKNYLLSRSGSEKLAETQARWLEMIGILESTSEDDIIVTFLRHYWSSLNGLTRERDLYKQVKRKITNARLATELAMQLALSARVYSALANPSHDLWNEFGTTSKGHIATLNLLRMTQLRPLLLAIVEKINVQEARKAFGYLVACAVRVLIVGSRGGTVEETYSDVAKKIREGSVKTASAIRKEMEFIYPPDSQFRDAFAVATVSKEYLARYYLRALEKAANGETDPEYVPNPNEEEINLEHIIPERPSNNWPNLSLDQCKSLYKRIGNLALLKATDNVSIGNKTFDEKQNVLKKSAFTLTSDVAKNPVWNEETISERQRKLADLAVQVWSSKFA